MSTPLNWDRDGRDWPNRENSRFEVAAGLRWHVQQSGTGTPLLLVHGTGASTHSWRDVAPLLSAHFEVLAVDLPGHGFTQRPSARQLSLPSMADALASLLESLKFTPSMAVGHSAGAAILCRMCLDRRISPERLVGLNAALLPFRGIAGELFPRMARILFLNPFVPYTFAKAAAKPGRVEKLIRETGSTLDERGLALYRRLFCNPSHVAATLGMMANWDLHSLVRDIAGLPLPLHLVVGERDSAVSPGDADTIAARVDGTRVSVLPGLGHLAHEEAPQKVADLLCEPC